MLPEAEKEKVVLLQAVCAVCDVPLVGGIFPALVKDGQFFTEGVWLLGFAEMPYCALHDNLPTDGDAEHAMEHIAAGLREQIDHLPDITLFLLFDAMLPRSARCSIVCI